MAIKILKLLLFLKHIISKFNFLYFIYLMNKKNYFIYNYYNITIYIYIFNKLINFKNIYSFLLIKFIFLLNKKK